jgi:urea transporter
MEIGFVVQDWFVVFGSVKVRRLEFSISSSPTQIRLSKEVVFVEVPQLIAKL